MKIGFVYAGQGSQKVGMGADLYEAYPAAKRLLDDIQLDFDVRDVCFHGPAETLNRTAYTQPCMVAMAIVITRLLADSGIQPEMAAGLSLGEYSALYAAGVFDEKTALALVRFRGLAMEAAAKGLQTKMAAVLGLDRAALQTACDQAAESGVVQICNYNCPGQLVIGGEAAAVDKASEIAVSLKAKRVIPLNVSGPFHTKLMQPASEQLSGKFKETTFLKPKIPVIFNTTAQPLREGETVRELLTKQVMSPVYFEDSIRTMMGAGVDTIVEIGPGRVLGGFIKKINKELPVYAAEDAASLQATIAALKEKEQSQ